MSWLVSALLGFLAKFGLGFARDRKAEAGQRRSGATETTSAVNKETADAERRSSDAAINAKAGADLDDDLASGKRQF